MPEIHSVPSVPSVEDVPPLVPEDETAEDLFPQPRCAHPETRTETMLDGSRMRRCTTCKRVVQVINHP